MPPPPLTTIYKEINSSKISTDIYLPPPTSSPNNSAEQKHHPVLINIHGGAFMLGHSGMVSMPQIDDCLARGWIVVVPNHRLCPGVDVLTGPIADIRDLLVWIYDGSLDGYLREDGRDEYKVDMNKVMAFGTSSGGFLAMSLGYDVPRPPAAILNFYGAAHFKDPFWKTPLPHVQASLPESGFDETFLKSVYTEFPIATTSGISLEGPSSESKPNKPDFSRPRDAFAITQIASGAVLNAIYPNGDLGNIDPVERVTDGFPPTFIVHGDADKMVPVWLNRRLYGVLQEKGVECEMVEIPGEGHTFAMGMAVGSRTWDLSRQGFEWLERIISEL
ncbi:Alpha/Beta hydrolase protein [Aspergillus californicus]